MSCQWGLNGDSACIFQWNTGRQLILLFKRHWFLKQKTRQHFPLCCRLSLFRAFCFPWIQIACLFFFIIIMSVFPQGDQDLEMSFVAHLRISGITSETAHPHWKQTVSSLHSVHLNITCTSLLWELLWPSPVFSFCNKHLSLSPLKLAN